MRMLLIVVLVAACATGRSQPLGSTRSVVAMRDDAPVGRVLTVSDEPKRISTPFDDLGRNMVDSFSGYNLLFHVTAVGSTGALVATGADHEVHVQLGRDHHDHLWADIANIAGLVAPLGTGAALWVTGFATRDPELAGAGSAALQALGVSALATGILKVGTGREYPSREADLDTPNRARDFDPFGNRLAAWPSGHTSTSISVAAALTAYAPDKWWIPALGYPLALGIGVGMIDRDSHWASDVVAGALIGHAVGWTIGRNFRMRVREGKLSERAIYVVPMGAQGVAVSAAW